MFEDLYDTLRMLFSFSWPMAEAEITGVEIETIPHTQRQGELRLSVCYRFFVGDDGPYCGESFWKPTFTVLASMEDAKQVMELKRTVPVRYRADDPSQNRLDRQAWRDL